MSAPILNVFSESDIQYLLQLPEVQEARARLGASVRFKIPVTETIRTALEDRLGLNLGNVTDIPMRWIKGDTAPHIDRGASTFEHTYLVYINDSEGSFILGTDSYPIQANTAFVFNEGILHKTEDTGLEPRLLIGPMNELAEPVGSVIDYYPTEADALVGGIVNRLGSSGSYTVGQGGPFGPGTGYTAWRIASNSTGSSPQNRIYRNGDPLNSGGHYYLYATTPCFKEGTKILCQINGVDT